MKSWTRIEAMTVICAGAAGLMLGTPALAQEASPKPAAETAATSAADEDMVMPEDATAPDETPDAVNPDAPDPVLTEEATAGAKPDSPAEAKPPAP